MGFRDEQLNEDWVDGGVLRVDRGLRDLVRKSGLCEVSEREKGRPSTLPIPHLGETGFYNLGPPNVYLARSLPR